MINLWVINDFLKLNEGDLANKYTKPVKYMYYGIIRIHDGSICVEFLGSPSPQIHSWPNTNLNRLSYLWIELNIFCWLNQMD